MGGGVALRPQRRVWGGGCCFTSTEAGMGGGGGGGSGRQRLDFHTAPELSNADQGLCKIYILTQ